MIREIFSFILIILMIPLMIPYILYLWVKERLRCLKNERKGGYMIRTSHLRRCAHRELTKTMISYKVITKCLQCGKRFFDGGKLWEKTPAPKWDYSGIR